MAGESMFLSRGIRSDASRDSPQLLHNAKIDSKKGLQQQRR